MAEISRRTLIPYGALATLAAFAWSGAGRAEEREPLPAPDPGPSDQALIALYDEWRIVATEEDRLFDLQSAAEDRMVYPEPPEALFRRPGDTVHFFGFVGYRHISGRLWYGASCSIEALREMSCTRTNGAHDWVDRQAANRRDAIVAAYESWKAAIKANAEACGLSDATRLVDAAVERNRALRRKIVEMPARTLQGILVKLLVARWCAPDFDTLAQDSLARSGPTYEALIFAAMHDLIEVVEATYGRRSAA